MCIIHCDILLLEPWVRTPLPARLLCLQVGRNVQRELAICNLPIIMAHLFRDGRIHLSQSQAIDTRKIKSVAVCSYLLSVSLCLCNLWDRAFPKRNVSRTLTEPSVTIWQQIYLLWIEDIKSILLFILSYVQITHAYVWMFYSTCTLHKRNE